eukprot:730656-Amphidinium_carterae.1
MECLGLNGSSSVSLTPNCAQTKTSRLVFLLTTHVVTQESVPAGTIVVRQGDAGDKFRPESVGKRCGVYGYPFELGLKKRYFIISDVAMSWLS